MNSAGYKTIPKNHPWEQYDHVIVFDGICNFCNASVNFVMERDPEKAFKFATLQSEAGQEVLKFNKLNAQDFETFLYIQNGHVFSQSTAALKVAQRLSAPWPMLYLFRVIPQSIRDSVYRFVGKRRYQWMGKREVCRIPTTAEQERFV